MKNRIALPWNGAGSTAFFFAFLCKEHSLVTLTRIIPCALVEQNAQLMSND